MNKKILILSTSLLTSLFSISSTSNAADFLEFSGSKTLVGNNTFNLAPVYRGDILLGHNPGGNYGTYTHVMLAYNDTFNTCTKPSDWRYRDHGCAWYGLLIESGQNGSGDSIGIQDIWKVKENYDEVTHMGIKNWDHSAMSSLAGKAEYYRVNNNGPYTVNSYFYPLPDTTKWWCSKLVWKVAYDMGVDLRTGMDRYVNTLLFTPSMIYNSADTVVLSTTVGNGILGTNNKSKEVRVASSSNKETNDDIRLGKIEVLKVGLLDGLKQELSDKIKDQAYKEETKQDDDAIKNDIKQRVEDYKDQLKRIEKDPLSRERNLKIWGSLYDHNKLLKEAENFITDEFK